MQTKLNYFKPRLVIFIFLSLFTLNSVYAESFVYLKNPAGQLAGTIIYEDGFFASLKLKSYCFIRNWREGIVCEYLNNSSPLASDPSKSINVVSNNPNISPEEINKIKDDISQIAKKINLNLKNPKPEKLPDVFQSQNQIPSVPIISNSTAVSTSSDISNTNPNPQQVVYQVIERAVPGPRGEVGPQGPQGIAGQQGVPGISSAFNNYPTVTYSGTAQFNGSTDTNTAIKGQVANFTDLTANTYSGGGLTSCNSSTNKLIYNSTTKLFECSTDNTGSSGTFTGLSVNATGTSNLNTINSVNLYSSTTNATTSNSINSNVSNLLTTNNLTATGTTQLATLLASTTNASTTNTDNLISTNGTITNATITNLSIATLSPTNLTGTNATLTNSTTTNLSVSATTTSTGIAGSFATITVVNTNNLFSALLNSLLATITTLWGTTSNFATSNASTTNATTSNISTANITTGNITTLNSTNNYSQNIYATTSNATTTNTQNLIGTNATLTNATTTNLVVTGTFTNTSPASFSATATFATTTAASSTITNLNSNNGTINNFNGANSTITNSTSTNSFATNASSTNLYSALANLGILNAVYSYITTLFGNTANFVTSNASTTNATTSNSITDNTQFTNISNQLISNNINSTGTSNLATLNSSTTNTTNLINTNATITNATITNLSITTLNPTNLTSTNSTITNSTSTNANISNLTGTNIFISGSSTLGSTTLSNLTTQTIGANTVNVNNLNNSNATITNATTTNLFSTTASSTNLFAAIARFGESVIQQLTATLATITTLWGTTANFLTLNASTTNATTSNAVNAIFTNGQISTLNSTTGYFLNSYSSTTYATTSNTTGLTTTGNLFVTASSTFASSTFGNSTFMGTTNFASAPNIPLTNGYTWRGSSAGLQEATSSLFVAESGSVIIKKTSAPEIILEENNVTASNYYSNSVGTALTESRNNLDLTFQNSNTGTGLVKLVNNFDKSLSLNNLGQVALSHSGVFSPSGYVAGSSGFTFGNSYAYYQPDRVTFGSSIANYYILNQASVGVVLPNGNTSWSSQSDQRLKKDIVPLGTDNGLDAILKLKPVSYKWINPGAATTTQLGFIAQEVGEIFPQLVTIGATSTETPDGTRYLNYEGLISPIISAIQEIFKKITNIIVRLDNHDTEIANLKQEVFFLKKSNNLINSSNNNNNWEVLGVGTTTATSTQDVQADNGQNVGSTSTATLETQIPTETSTIMELMQSTTAPEISG